MTGPEPTPNPPPATSQASDRVRLRTYRERRRRVWRSIALVVITTTIIIVLFAANRDEAAIRTCRKRMEVARQALQARHDAGLPPAPRLPLPEASDPEMVRLNVDQLRYHTYYNALHDHLSAGRAEVGVCCCRWPHARLLGHSGRNVIVFDTAREKYELRWMNEEEFARLARDLRLTIPGQIPAREPGQR